MTLLDGLMAALVALAAGVLIVALLARPVVREAARDLRTLVRYAGSNARVTRVAPGATAPAVAHLVLMDKSEKRVDYVMVIDPAQRAQTVTYGPHVYACVSGSVEDGYFVYRQQ